MIDSEQRFQEIFDRLEREGEDVVMGKMMRSPGMKYADNVFAFLRKESMGFRLGPAFDPEASRLKDIGPLSPFKTKPPLKGWYVVGTGDGDRWEELTREALAFTKEMVG